MTDKELLATIAKQFDFLDLYDANIMEAMICKLLVEHGYLTVETVPLEDDLYSEYRFNPTCPED
tara:strand:- start:534 stop:725 length:192 start_codon:yes stop_codon:yes gene_type:complete